MYELVRTLPPFSKWGLPEADEVEFHISGFRDKHGDYSKDPHTIRLSRHSTAHLNTALEVMAHETLHMAQAILRIAPKHEGHDAWFREKWVHIAKDYGWDAKKFLL